VFIRIGSCFPEPINATERVGCCVVWGASNNQRMTWWKDDVRTKLGWQPLDSADRFAGQLAGKVSGDPVEERYMGGAFCSMDYSRESPAPQRLFD
jgi:uronate dehydrogenase